MEKKDLKIVFFGTPEFAVTSLDALVKNEFNVAAVVTMPDKPAGRGKKIQMSDVKRYALEHDLPVLQPEKLKAPEFVDALRAIDADLFIVIAFRMLPEVVWGMPRLGTFNLHASLLPKYRGAAPINHAIINGEKVTGITTFFLKHEIDTGDMIAQRSIAIGEDENAGELHDRLMMLGAEAVVDTVNAIIDGTLTTSPQPEGEFIAAPKIFKETCRIDWERPRKNLHDFIRGLAPYPAAWTRMIEQSGKPSDIKIFATSLKDIPSDISLLPGEALVKGKHLYAGTADGVLEILSLQPAGKRAMGADAFILGYHPARFE
ncbi:MAG: methionyl-tRNA formyltransferase [Muribaculaceae bacterium]|nr:methionyl-tRNA formyltransferase [Muribaculaceae bacterium]